MKITLTEDSGEIRDVTEEVQLLWDSVVGSLDWGSGFLDAEEILQVIRIGKAMGCDFSKVRIPLGHYGQESEWDRITAEIERLRVFADDGTGESAER